MQNENTEQVEMVFLSRRNLLTLLSKLDRKKAGEQTYCQIIKKDNKHPKYAQSPACVIVTAVEDDEYYADRDAGEVLPQDDPGVNYG